MSREVTLFKSKERRNKDEVVAFLHQLADKIDSGTVVLSQGSEELTLNLADNITLEVEVEEEKKRSKGIQYSLEVELKWYENDKRPSKGLVLK